MNGEGRKLSTEELRLWREAMSKHPADLKIENNQKITSNSASHDLSKVNSANNKKTFVSRDAPGGIDKHASRAIRRGKIAIEDKIDLHGMTQAQAHNELSKFLKINARRGVRCVLVITGKGGREVRDQSNIFSTRGTGIIRKQLTYWLAEPELASIVIGSEKALPKDRGSGARYVLLRKN